MSGDLEIRPARPEDLPEIERIQAASPEAAAWKPVGYLDYDCRIAWAGGLVVGFVVLRRVGEEETEILNLAIDPARRRRGVATALLGKVLKGLHGTVFLEVRASNHAARALYRKLGFRESAIRRMYYNDPSEDGIVMRWQSC